MKKRFPLIALFIAASVIALFVMQGLYIKNALEVQKGKYNNDLENSFADFKIGLMNKIAQTLGYRPASLDWESRKQENQDFLWSQLVEVPKEDIKAIIKKELVKNNIEHDFEFRITRGPQTVSSSYGFVKSMESKSFNRPLTNDDNTQLYLYIKQPSNYIVQRSALVILFSVVLCTIIIVAFIITVATVFKQKKLSEIKTDFINNMTHEFKTPLATISLAVDALGYEKVRSNKDQIGYYAGIIKEENARMHRQVEKILQAAQLDTNNLELKLQALDVHEIIRRAANNITLMVEEKNGRLIQKLQAKTFRLQADEVHFENLINNLLDNAVKYSNAPIRIEIETKSTSKLLTICIKDNGIGMTQDTVKQIFEKFYRAHTGNLHNVKGFGLGLNYVKNVVLAHHGKIEVESSPNKGSTFILKFPLQAKR